MCTAERRGICDERNGDENYEDDENFLLQERDLIEETFLPGSRGEKVMRHALKTVEVATKMVSFWKGDTVVEDKKKSDDVETTKAKEDNIARKRIEFIKMYSNMHNMVNIEFMEKIERKRKASEISFFLNKCDDPMVRLETLISLIMPLKDSMIRVDQEGVYFQTFSNLFPDFFELLLTFLF